MRVSFHRVLRVSEMKFMRQQFLAQTLLIVALLFTPSFGTVFATSKCVSGVCGTFAVPNATANPNNATQDPIAATLNFDNWMSVIGGILDKVQAKNNFRLIGWGIFGIAVYFACIKLVQAGGVFEGFEQVVIRLFIAAAVIIGSDALGDLFKDTWHWGYKESASRIGEIYNASSNALGDVAARWPTQRMQIETLNAVTKGRSSASVRTQNVESDPVANLAMNSMVWIAGMFNTLLSAFYMFTVLSSIFTIILGKILLPVIGASLAFPGDLGVSSFSTWARTMLVAVFAGYFVPLLFGVASFIAVLIPMLHVQQTFDLVDQATRTMQGAVNTAGGGTVSNDPNVIQAAIDSLGGAWLGNTINLVLKSLTVMLALPAMMLIALIVAGNIVMRSMSWLASLLGGVAANSGYSNGVAGTVASVAAGAATYGVGRAAGSVAQGAAQALGGGVSRLAGAARSLFSRGGGAVGSSASRSSPAMNLARASSNGSARQVTVIPPQTRSAIQSNAQQRGGPRALPGSKS
jgi:hypothetical protein